MPSHVRSAGILLIRAGRHGGSAINAHPRPPSVVIIVGRILV